MLARTSTAAFLFLLAACSDVSQPMAPQSALSQSASADRVITRFTIRPDATDPGINVALDDYIIRIPHGGSNGRLFVYLPSSRIGPWTAEVIQEEAARLGYHVIGLSYPNDPGLVSYCGPAPDPNACYESSRLEVITGQDLSPFVDVNVANSIDNRLARLLEHLSMNRDGEGWDRFLQGDAPKWKHIAVGGHSQGAGFAAMLAKLRLVERAVMFSGVTDAVGGVAADWVRPGSTPSSRLYGLVHLQDNQFRPGILANWAALGMDAFGDAVTPEASEPPYGGTRMFVTNIAPSNGSFAAPAPHGSTAVDLFTPFNADGTPTLRPVWQYMLGYCSPTGHEHGDPQVAAVIEPCNTDR